MTDPPKIFISYSWADKALARRVARRLAHAGATVFLDEERDAELGAGSLVSGLHDAIATASHVVVIWTKSAAESAKPGGWVARELEFVEERAGNVQFIPLLFTNPKLNATINEALGVEFPAPHRFERSFAVLLSRIFESPLEPAVQTLVRDFEDTLREAPQIAAALAYPIEEALVDRGRVNESSESALDVARRAFQSWTPDRFSTLGLPTIMDPDFHALDFAMWCAARIALADSTHPANAAYPGIFARILGATGAGFEALVALITANPGLAADATSELIDPASISDEALPVVVAFYDGAFQCAVKSGTHTPAPFDSAARFVRANEDRLAEDQKLMLFRLVENTGNKPYPGGPLDLLGAFTVDPFFRTEITRRIKAWTDAGLFDQTDEVRGSEHPAQFFGFVGGMIKRKMTEDADWLLEQAAYPRIRKLLRSRDSSSVVAGLRWTVNADRLPPDSRLVISRAYADGVYSSEFESWSHAEAIRSAAEVVAWSLEREPRIDGRAVSELNRALRESGLPEV
jgi:hypothetical protein